MKSQSSIHSKDEEQIFYDDILESSISNEFKIDKDHNQTISPKKDVKKNQKVLFEAVPEVSDSENDSSDFDQSSDYSSSESDDCQLTKSQNNLLSGQNQELFSPLKNQMINNQFENVQKKSQDQQDKKLQNQTKVNFSEIRMFSKEFLVEYNHYDSKQLRNENQIKMTALCEDMGVQMVSSDQQEVIDIIYKMLSEEEKSQSHKSLLKNQQHNLMKIDVLFGNQNIKETMISRLESTENFIDQELTFRFRPITFIYRQEFANFFKQFISIKEGINDEVKLRALERYERLRQNITLEKVFENQNQIRSNTRLHIELDSSKIIVPIQESGLSIKPECWLFNTGHILVTNSKLQFNQLSFNQVETNETFKDWKCDTGYKPLHLSVIQLNMAYCSNINDIAGHLAESNKQNVLKDLNIRIMAMLRENDQIKQIQQVNKGATLREPLMKLKIAAEELRLIFNPITYVHIVNIGKCFQGQQQDVQTKQAQREKLKERLNIILKAKAIDQVRKKSNTSGQYWVDSIAIFSGKYIYFFNLQQAQSLKELSLYLKRIESRIKLKQQIIVKNSTDYLPQPNIQDEEFSENLEYYKKADQDDKEQEILNLALRRLKHDQNLILALNNLIYDEYFLVKGCTNIQSIAEYKKQIEVRKNVLLGRQSLKNKLNLFKKDQEYNSRLSVGNELNLQDNKLEVGTQLRLKNSMNTECIIQFKELEIQEKWRDLITQTAEEIDQVLGKNTHLLGYNLKDNNLVEANNLELKGVVESEEQLNKKTSEFIGEGQIGLQVLSHYNVKFGKFELIVQSTSKIYLNSKLADGKTKDQIILSTQQPTQFNKPEQDTFDRDLGVKWSYSLVATNFAFIQSSRQFDSDKLITIEALLIDERDPNYISNRIMNTRYPMLMRTIMSNDKKKQIKNVLRILIKSQQIESPRYNNILMENEINLGKIHFDWNPVSINRFVRFFRFYKYAEDVVEYEKLKLKQSFKIQLENLHKKQEDSFQKEIKIEKPKLRKQQTIEPSLIQDFNNSIRNRQSLRHNKQNSIQNDFFIFDETPSRTTCTQDSTVFVSVSLSIEKIYVVCIHPQNDSFPIFTKKVDKLSLIYQSLMDHDTIEGKIGNFRIMDNTNYPQTLDPFKDYKQDDKVPQTQILGFRLLQNSSETNALTFDITMFHYPLDHCCPIQEKNNNQVNNTFDKLVKIQMQQLQILHMQELNFRLNDYFFYQIIYALTDANPYMDDILRRLKQEMDPFFKKEKSNKKKVKKQQQETKKEQILISDAYIYCEDSSISNVSENNSATTNSFSNSSDSENLNSFSSDEESFSKSQDKFDFLFNNQYFDLKQYPLTTGLDIKIENPLIVLKDRPYFDPDIQIDLGQIHISSSLQEVPGKWKQFPHKLTFVNTIQIFMSQVRIDYNKKSTMIAPPFDMNIDFTRINYSELLQEQFLSKGIDFEQFDKSDNLTIVSSAFQLNFDQPMYTYLLRCLDLNINFYDQMAHGFQLFTWNSQDYMKYLDLERDIVAKFKNRPVNKRIVQLKFPSLSIKIKDQKTEQNKDQILSELVLQNLQIDLFQYLDYRKHIKLNSQTIYILCKDLENSKNIQQEINKNDQNTKTLIIGPMKSSRIIQTQDNFYQGFTSQTPEKIKMPQICLVRDSQSSPDNYKKSNQIIFDNEDTKFQEWKPLDLSTASFSVDIKMQPDGERVTEIKLKELKLFLKIDALQVLSQFFSSNFPKYDKSSQDKPTYFEEDYGNYAKQEMLVDLNDCLICFEQTDDLIELNKEPFVKQSFSNFSSPSQSQRKQRKFQDKEQLKNNMELFNKTVAFQGQLQYNFVREKANQIKKDLLNDLESDDQYLKRTEGFQKRLKTTQVHIIDFQPFFCDKSDLYEGGIPLKMIQKRQMISPSNLFFNQNDIIEIKEKQIKQTKKKYQKQLKQITDPQKISGSGGIEQDYPRKSKVVDQTKEEELKEKEKKDLLNDNNFIQYKKCELNFDLAEIQISFNELISLKGLQKKLSEMNKNFKQYCANIIDNEDIENDQSNIKLPHSIKPNFLQKKNKDESQSEEEEFNQSKGIDQFQLVSHGLKLILINDRENNFLPVLSLNFGHFTVYWDCNPNQSCLWTDLNMSSNFFNVNVGVWEPFIEPFNFKLILKEETVAKIRNVSLTFYTPLNINLTEKLVENLYESNQSWGLVNQRFEDFHQKFRQMQIDPGNYLQQSFVYTSDKKQSNSLLQQKGQQQLVKRDITEDWFENQKMKAEMKEETITPYVIVNKTDIAILIKTLDDIPQEYQFSNSFLNQFQDDQSYDQIKTNFGPKPFKNNQILHLFDPGQQNINQSFTDMQYRLEPGQIIDYMVDYSKSIKKKGKSQDCDLEEQISQNGISLVMDNENFFYPFSPPVPQRNATQISADLKENIHLDSIGEYKSEFVRVLFDSQSSQVNEGKINFSENRALDRVDLNEIGINHHVQRGGNFKETLFYSIKIIDFKKVFTIRTQFQLVNRTTVDYLVHFKFQNQSIVKFLESGDSLPLSMQFDTSQIQIKIITNKNIGQNKLQEEIIAQNQLVNDFKDQSWGPQISQNWSSLIPIQILKYRLPFYEGSYLKNGTSLFTYIRKVKADQAFPIIDINFMTPLIIKNCLPFEIQIAFKDSSNVIQSHSFTKNEEKYFYCFSLDISVNVDILVPGFKPKRGFKIVNLKRQNLTESQIEIEDELGLMTLIYSQLSRTQAGFRVVLYAKKLLIDQLNSKLQYFYYKPRFESLQQEYFNNLDQNKPQFDLIQEYEKDSQQYKSQNSLKMKQNQNKQGNNIFIDQLRIPFVLQIELKQRIFIIPEHFSKIFVAVTYQVDQEIQELDIETPTGQAIFRVQTKNKTFDYCASTNIYLATQNENIYSKISTINPLYIFVNESNYSIKIEQAEMKFHQKYLYSLAIDEASKSQTFFESLGLSGRDKQKNKIEEIQSKILVPLPLILAPKQRHAFFFQNIHTQIPGIEELIHISIADEFVSAQELQELVQEKNIKDFNDTESVYKHRQSNSTQFMDTISQISRQSNSNVKFSGQRSTIDPLKGNPQSQQYIFRPSTFGANRTNQTQQSQIISRDQVIFKKQYNWSSPFMISEVDTFTLRLNPFTQRKQSLLEQMNCLTMEERYLLTKILTQEKYLKVKIKADCKQAPGSMFILVDEEESDTCMYRIDNQSKHFDLIFSQNIGTHPFWNKRLNIQQNYQNQKSQESHTSYKCKSGKNQRFTWESILHQKVIRLSFTTKQTKSPHKPLDPSQKHEFTNYTESQKLRMLPCQSEAQRDDQPQDPSLTTSQKNKLTDLLIAFDKIGHAEKLHLQQADKAPQTINIEIKTNGFTKTLQISDEVEIQEETKKEQDCQMIELFFSRITLSIIHNKSELISIFISRLNSVFNESLLHRTFRFTVGYLQIDNQTEKMPVYPVLLKPKDLYYDKVQNSTQMCAGGEYTANDVSLFQFQMVVNNQQAVDKKHVMYIESIIFLLQTLQIKVQFDHFLKIINYGQHIGKILNKSVNVVHFLFDPNIKWKREHEFYEVKDQADQESNIENKKNKLKRFARIHNDKFLDPLSDLEYAQKIYNSVEAPILKVSQNSNNNQVLFSKKKIETVIMPIQENNWQFGGDLGSANEWRLFIKEYQSSPTELFVSCMNTRQSSLKREKHKSRTTLQDDQIGQSRTETLEEDDEDIKMQEEGAIQILGALGEVFVRKILYFSTFEDMQFQMKGINVSSLFGEGNEVVTYLLKYHKEQFKFNVFKLIGASNLIGNPTRFINNIGVGVTDFFVKPYQGVKDGDIQKFKEGFIDGSKSLIQKTFMAPVGAIATVGQSLSKGAIYLSFDDQFIDQKKLIESQNNPRSLQAGFKQGIASAQTSIKSGLSGLYNKPREGYHKDGVIGLVKGQVQGALGLVFKTISGGIDIVAKTSEGQYNELRGEVGLLSLVQRIREPREFYGEHSIIRVYPIAQEQMRMMDLIMTGLEQDIHGFYNIDEESYIE